MDSAEITQQEAAVPVPQPPKMEIVGAGVGVRFVALFIDGVILTAMFFVYVAFLSLLSGGGFSTSLQGASASFYFLIVASYFVLLEWKQGATIGKKAMKLHVEKIDGSPVTIGTSLARNVMRIIDGMFGYLVGAIAIWSSHRHQRLGDMVAGTIVRSLKH